MCVQHATFLSTQFAPPISELRGGLLRRMGASGDGAKRLLASGYYRISYGKIHGVRSDVVGIYSRI